MMFLKLMKCCLSMTSRCWEGERMDSEFYVIPLDREELLAFIQYLSAVIRKLK